MGDRRRRRDQGKPQHLGPGLGRRRPDSRMSERVATSERARERETGGKRDAADGRGSRLCIGGKKTHGLLVGRFQFL